MKRGDVNGGHNPPAASGAAQAAATIGIRSNNAQLLFNSNKRNANRRRAPASHSGLPEARMNHLFMRALHRAAAEPITQPQVFVIAHPAGIFAVIPNERSQAVAHRWRFRPQPLQSGSSSTPSNRKWFVFN